MQAKLAKDNRRYLNLGTFSTGLVDLTNACCSALQRIAAATSPECANTDVRGNSTVRRGTECGVLLVELGTLWPGWTLSHAEEASHFFQPQLNSVRWPVARGFETVVEGLSRDRRS